MSITVRIPTALRGYAGGTAEVEITAPTVGDALTRVVERYPQLKPHLYDERGQLRNFVNAYVNENDVRALDGTSTALRDGDAITLVPSIAGGTPSV
jgi:MoaD family protein